MNEPKPTEEMIVPNAPAAEATEDEGDEVDSQSSPTPTTEEAADGKDSAEGEGEQKEIVVDESPETVEIDGKTYTTDELDQIVALGKNVHEYRKDHPGFDPILLHKDYTVKSMELAELKRSKVNPQDVAHVERSAETTQPDLSKFNPEDVKVFSEMANAMGFVRSADLEAKERLGHQAALKAAEKATTNAFLDEHPEYKPENDPGDMRWKKLVSEYGLYKSPENPAQIKELLERAHRNAFGLSPVSTNSSQTKKLADILAKKKAGKTGQSSSGGSAGGASRAAGPRVAKTEFERLVAAGGLKGFSDDEIKAMADKQT